MRPGAPRWVAAAAQRGGLLPGIRARAPLALIGGWFGPTAAKIPALLRPSGSFGFREGTPSWMASAMRNLGLLPGLRLRAPLGLNGRWSGLLAVKIPGLLRASGSFGFGAGAPRRGASAKQRLGSRPGIRPRASLGLIGGRCSGSVAVKIPGLPRLSGSFGFRTGACAATDPRRPPAVWARRK